MWVAWITRRINHAHADFAATEPPGEQQLLNLSALTEAHLSLLDAFRIEAAACAEARRSFNLPQKVAKSGAFIS